jgi:hypothetical protein
LEAWSEDSDLPFDTPERASESFRRIRELKMVGTLADHGALPIARDSQVTTSDELESELADWRP